MVRPRIEKVEGGDVVAWIELRDGLPVIATDRPVEPLSVEDVRLAIDGGRR